MAHQIALEGAYVGTGRLCQSIRESIWSEVLGKRNNEKKGESSKSICSNVIGERIGKERPKEGFEPG